MSVGALKMHADSAEEAPKAAMDDFLLTCISNLIIDYLLVVCIHYIV